MNEPVVPGRKPRKDWLGPPFAGKYFVQFITLETRGRKREEIAKAWIRQLVLAIRKHDPKHLITVGLVPWSLPRPGKLTSGLDPKTVAPLLDFVAVHLYPEQGKLEEALETLRGFAVGKPLLVEEFFPLRCSLEELEELVERSEGWVAGWVGFYWGKTLEACRQGRTIQDALTAKWLEFFQKETEKIQGNRSSKR